MPKLLLALLLAAAPSIMAAPSSAAVAIAAQTDPAKLATLKGERAANPRMQRCVYWLATAEAGGERWKGRGSKMSEITYKLKPAEGFVRERGL